MKLSGGLQGQSSKVGLIVPFIILISIFAIFARLVPHAPNFTPVGALALFAGVYLPKKWGLFVPLAVMGVSDFFIGFYSFKLMAVVYSSFLLMVLMGRSLGKSASVWKIGLGAIGGSFAFFLITNFAVWALSAWYPPTLGGLMSAYAMGLPFFRMTLLSNLSYTYAIFGAYELVKLVERQKLAYTSSIRVKISA